MEKGHHLIGFKREKHESKGFGYNHDTEHTYMDFVNAAKAYMYKDPYSWPFDKESLNLTDTVEDLVNAGSMIAAAIDRLQRYEIGNVYEVKIPNGQSGKFQVTHINILKSGTVLISFIGISGELKPDKQQFMLSSQFDKYSGPVKDI